MLRSISLNLLCLFALIISKCVASSYLSAVVESSHHGRRSSWYKDIPSGRGGDDEENDLETQTVARSLPGYSSDGRCGPAHGGLMCDPNSTVYIVSNPALSLLRLVLTLQFRGPVAQ